MTQVKLGDKNIPFIYQGNELLYPNPIKDGLVLWYDFKGMSNTSANKDVAKDLSGNGNDGTLQNFAYTSGSGYNNGLVLDKVDDDLTTNLPLNKSFTILLTLNVNFSKNVQFFFGGNYGGFYLRKNFNRLHASVVTTKQFSFGGNTFFANTNNALAMKCQVALVVDDSTNKAKTYGNGILMSEVLIDGSVPNYVLTRLGGWSSGTKSDDLDGNLLSTQVYNRVLTEQEIQHNYKLEKERWGL